MSLGCDGFARVKMPVTFFCIANAFGKYDYEESKAIPIELLTRQSLIALPIDSPTSHSAYAHIQSSYLIGFLWISHTVEGQRAANAQWKSSKPSDVSRFMKPFDSCIFFPCGLPAEEITSQPFPAIKWLAVL